MSEQSKSNVQALGAGLMGFAAVMVVGGAALLVHRSQQAKADAAPAAAAAPIDLGSSMPHPSLSPTAHKERRAESPAPLIGDAEEAQAPEVPSEARAAGGASAASPASAAPARAAGGRLEVTRHLDAEGGSTTAVATVNDALSPEKAPSAPEKALPRRKAAPLPETTSGAIASVHYGATSRSELMGRAAGPVYNVKGGGRTAAGPTGKMADDVTIKISELKRQLDSAELPPQDREKLQKELDAVTKGLAAPPAAQ